MTYMELVKPTLTAEGAFIAAIIEAPDDDATRVVFADWLEERADAVDLRELREAKEAIEYLSKDQFLVLPESPRGQRIEAIRRRQRELEEALSGKGRAEFIRVQCRLASLGPTKCTHAEEPAASYCTGCAKHWPLRRRERELLDAQTDGEPNAWKWMGSPDGLDAAGPCTDYKAVPPITSHGVWLDEGNPLLMVDFRRGFVEDVRCAGADWVKHADAITAVAPIRRVTLTALPELGIETNFLEAATRGGFYLAGRKTRLRTMADPTTEAVAQLLKLHWPKIAFTLPE